MSCNRIEPEQTHGKTKRRRRSIKNGQIFTVNAKEHFDRCNSITQCIMYKDISICKRDNVVADPGTYMLF